MYRGSALPALVGSYLFADYGSGRIWRLVSNGGGGFTAQELLDTNLSIASFAKATTASCTSIDIAGGGLYKIVDGGGRSDGPAGADVAVGYGMRRRFESERTGFGPRSLRVAAAFWSDGAAKERWLGIPNGTSIAVGGDGDFTSGSSPLSRRSPRLDRASRCRP